MKIKYLIIFLVSFLFSQLAFAAKINVEVNGVVCAFCAQGIKKQFKKIDAVESIDVSLEEKRVTLETKEGQDVSDEKIKSLINDAGFEVVKIERGKS
jgi:mercuric ion binding protein